MYRSFLSLAVVGSVTVLSLLPAVLYGQSCSTVIRRPYHSSPSYCAPVYDPPALVVQDRVVVQEVLTPAFVFQVVDAYRPPVSTPISTVLPTQPVLQTQPVISSGGLSQQDVDLVAKRVVQLLKETGNPNDPPALNVGDNLNQFQQPKSGALQTEAIQHFANSCFKCHNSEKAKGKLILFDNAGEGKVAWNPRYTDGRPLEPSVLLEVIEGGTMPPAGEGERVPANIVALVKAWRK